MKTVLATIKLSEKQKIALENAGFLVVEKKFITTKSCIFKIKKLNKNIIVTSKNAVKSILKSSYNLKDKNVFCVGKKTKKALVENGFQVVASANYAEDLAQKIAANFSTESFTFFSGNLRLNTLPEAFLKNNIEFNEVEVYKTKLKPHKINTAIDVALFFSPSSVNSFLVNNATEDKSCICIGKTTAKALKNNAKQIFVAAKPSINEVIACCIKNIKNI